MRKLSRESVRRALVSVPRRARGRHGLRGVVSLAHFIKRRNTPVEGYWGGGQVTVMAKKGQNRSILDCSGKHDVLRIIVRCSPQREARHRLSSVWRWWILRNNL